MPVYGLIVAGFIIGGGMTIVSLLMFIFEVCRNYGTHIKSSAGAGFVAWILLFIGGSLLCISIGYNNLGQGWTAPPAEGTYRVTGERQGHMGLAPINQPDYKAVGHDFDPRTVDRVDVQPNDKRAGTAQIVGPRGHRRITVYLIKQVENPESVAGKKLKTNP